MEEQLEKEIMGLALQNASEHGGKTSPKIVLAKIMGSRPELRSRASELAAGIAGIVAQANAMDAAGQKAALEAGYPGLLAPREKPAVRQGLPPLEGAVQGEVVTRFPPEPSGYPHIGHAKAAIINKEYSRMYGGRLILRLDDTNPENARLEFYAAIKVGLEWLGVEYDEIKNTSDDIEMLLDKGGQLLRSGGAYVCTCKRQDVSKNRQESRPCKCSKAGPEDVLERWDRMFGKYKPGQAMVRFRGDMSSPNTAMRDPALFRIVEGKHPLLGTKYSVWPSYDFAIAVEDSIDGVTHAFRSKEYELRRELYYSLLDRLGMRKPVMAEFSRLEFDGMPVSKRVLRQLVYDGKVSGFDDPRLPTLEGLKRRGVDPAAVRKFVLSLGMTKADTLAPFDALEAINRKEIDAHSVRLFMAKDPVEVRVSGLPAEAVIENHPSGQMGKRTIPAGGSVCISAEDAAKLSAGSRLRLLGLGNITVGEAGPPVMASYDGDDAGADIAKVQWVPKEGSKKVRIMVPGRLMNGEEFNSGSLEEHIVLAEPHYMQLPDGQAIQFVRYGYCKKETANAAVFTHR